MEIISDIALNNYYGKDYYGEGIGYFDDPWTEDDLMEVEDDEESF